MTAFHIVHLNIDSPARAGTLLSIAGAVIALALTVFVLGSTAAHGPAAADNPAAALYGP